MRAGPRRISNVYQSDIIARLLRGIANRDMLDPMRRRKPKCDRKEATILIRLTEGQKATIAQAAKKVGLGLSGWVLSLALREASTLDVGS